MDSEIKDLLVSEEESAKVIAFLNTKVRGGCPVCGGTKWETGPLVFEHGYRRDDATTAMRGLVVLPMICLNCTFVMHFQWKRLKESL